MWVRPLSSTHRQIGVAAVTDDNRLSDAATSATFKRLRGHDRAGPHAGCRMPIDAVGAQALAMVVS